MKRDAGLRATKRDLAQVFEKLFQIILLLLHLSIVLHGTTLNSKMEQIRVMNSLSLNTWGILYH